MSDKENVLNELLATIFGKQSLAKVNIELSDEHAPEPIPNEQTPSPLIKYASIILQALLGIAIGFAVGSIIGFLGMLAITEIGAVLEPIFG